MARLKKYITNRGFLPEATPLKAVHNTTASTEIINNVALELPKTSSYQSNTSNNKQNKKFRSTSK